MGFADEASDEDMAKFLAEIRQKGYAKRERFLYGVAPVLLP
jgi:hypothetical protein